MSYHCIFKKKCKKPESKLNSVLREALANYAQTKRLNRKALSRVDGEPTVNNCGQFSPVPRVSRAPATTL